MTVILSIIALVAAISLYDYFGSRSWQQVTSSVRNNVVFENRNREYGAYVIRKDYDKNMLIIMASVMFSVGGLYAAYAGFRTGSGNATFVPPTTTVDITPVYVAKKEEPEIMLPKKQEPITTEKMEKFTEPKVSDEKLKEEIKLQEELEKGKVGPVETEKKGEGIVTIQQTKEKEKEKETEITPTGPEKWVDVEAQFPGGFAAMAKFIQDHMVYPDEAIGINIQGKCYLQFVVGEDGSISSVKVLRGLSGCPECDRAATKVIKMMPKWTPGKLRGKNVSSYFDLPINFELQ